VLGLLSAGVDVLGGWSSVLNVVGINDISVSPEYKVK